VRDILGDVRTQGLGEVRSKRDEYVQKADQYWGYAYKVRDSGSDSAVQSHVNRALCQLPL
jgi:CRISPR/Cas system CSM-associated protein Csm3 (group 7 of RAMP superfamily)